MFIPLMCYLLIHYIVLVPVSIEDLDSTVRVIEAGEAQQQTIPLTIVTDFFSARSIGTIQEKHLIGGRSDKLNEKLQGYIKLYS